MATVDNLRDSLINKILLIRDRELLSALDKMASASSKETKVNLTNDQIEMIQIGLEEYKNGQFINQDKLFERELKWLNINP